MAARSPAGVKTGCGMRTIDHAVDAEVGQLLDRARAVDDDAVDRPEHLPPEVELVGRSTRQHVVCREDDGPIALNRGQPAQVVARQSQPLDVQHIGVEPRDLLLEPPGARHVLGAFVTKRSRERGLSPQQAAAVPEEDVVLAVAVRRRQRRKETRGEQSTSCPRRASAAARLRS